MKLLSIYSQLHRTKFPFYPRYHSRGGIAAAGFTFVALITGLLGCDGNRGTKIQETGQVIAARTDEQAMQAAPVPPAMPVVKTFHLGEPVQLGDYVITVEKCEDNLMPKNRYMRPDADKKIFAVEVVYENKTADREISYNPFDWKLTDAGGYTFDMMIGGAKEPTLSSGKLSPGQHTRGWINFSPTKLSTGFTLKFSKPLGDGSLDFDCEPRKPTDDDNKSVAALGEKLANEYCQCKDPNCTAVAEVGLKTFFEEAKKFKVETTYVQPAIDIANACSPPTR